MFKVIIKILLLILLFSILAQAGNTGNIIYVVTDSATTQPIADVTIRLPKKSGGTRYAYTDLNGEAIMHNIDSGFYKIIVTIRDYYEKEIYDVKVIADSVVIQNINLSRRKSTAEIISVTKIQTNENNSQSGAIKGIVVDGRTGEPVRGGTVIIKKTVLGSITNPDGEFLIDSIPPGSYNIISDCQDYHRFYHRDNIPNFEIKPNSAYELKIKLFHYYKIIPKGGSWGFKSNVPQPIIKSSAFKDGGMLPAKYTCDGKNISPPFEVYNLPKQTKSWGIICEEINAIEGNKVNWIIYNIPAQLTKLPQNVSKLINPIIKKRFRRIRLGQGQNDFGEIGYSGPCPPNGKKYIYRFKLFPLKEFLRIDEDIQASGITRKEFLKIISGLAIGSDYLEVKYWRE